MKNIDDKVIGMVIAITLVKSSNAFADRNLAVKCKEKDWHIPEIAIVIIPNASQTTCAFRRGCFSGTDFW